jgi:hypothetical protein
MRGLVLKRCLECCYVQFEKDRSVAVEAERLQQNKKLLTGGVS